MAILKNTTIDNTTSFSLPEGTTGQRPASPEEGAARYNTTTTATEYYDGTTWRNIEGRMFVTASTGSPQIFDSGIYRVYRFTGIGSITFSHYTGNIEVLIVGGGASGGRGWGAAGGGGGGLIYKTLEVSPNTYSITVGGGGAAQTSDNVRGNNGQDSVAFGLTALGGGGGGNHSSGTGVAGGSGGGHGREGAGAAGNQPGSGSGGFGNQGGVGIYNCAAGYAGGGGGGAGTVGGASDGESPGPGGMGVPIDITGVPIFYAGGGGGGAGPRYSGRSCGGSGLNGYPGPGGGGRGAEGNHNAGYAAHRIVGGNAYPNFGGGGGGGSYFTNQYYNSGAGGSGVVIIRYIR